MERRETPRSHTLTTPTLTALTVVEIVRHGRGLAGICDRHPHLRAVRTADQHQEGLGALGPCLLRVRFKFVHSNLMDVAKINKTKQTLK